MAMQGYIFKSLDAEYFFTKCKKNNLNMHLNAKMTIFLKTSCYRVFLHDFLPQEVHVPFDPTCPILTENQEVVQTHF